MLLILYYKTYEKVKSEPEISRMALVDICIEKFYSPTPDDTSEEKSSSAQTPY